MATCKRIDVPMYTLEINYKEAQLIGTLVGSCNGGDPVVQSVFNALTRAVVLVASTSLPNINLKDHPIKYLP